MKINPIQSVSPKKIRKTLLLFLGTYFGFLFMLTAILIIIAWSRGIEWPIIRYAVIPRLWGSFTQWPAQLFFCSPFLITLGSRYLIRVKRRRGNLILLRTVFTGLLLPFILFVSGSRLIVHYNLQDNSSYPGIPHSANTTGTPLNRFGTDHLFRGVSCFDWSKQDTSMLQELTRHNAEWIALVPVQRQLSSSRPVFYGPDSVGQWSRQDSAFIAMIRLARKHRFRIMLKPHLELLDGSWRGELHFSTEAEWQQWFAGYERLLRHYALLAQQEGVDLFCIGTELHSTVMHAPDKWETFIREVRAAYSGQLTYAANWDRGIQVPFWDQLDYIGIQSYYPLGQEPLPEIDRLITAWQGPKTELARLSARFQKPVLFTEIGYKSRLGTTIEPWVWPQGSDRFFHKRSNAAQANAYEALFQTFWNEPWFAGLFIWRWDQGRAKDSAQLFDFTPQGKPAEQVMAYWFSRYKK